MATINPWLFAGGAGSALAALAHLGCIVFGASWYRFFGAGEQMARQAAAGQLRPTLITLVIAGALGVWALYAYMAARGDALPAARFVLVAVTSVYLLRGVGGLFLIAQPLGRAPQFWAWSSAVCLLLGVVHAVGLARSWGALR
jgi:hypothetical protein